MRVIDVIDLLVMIMRVRVCVHVGFGRVLLVSSQILLFSGVLAGFCAVRRGGFRAVRDVVGSVLIGAS